MEKKIGAILIVIVVASVALIINTNSTDVLPTKIAIDTPTDAAIEVASTTDEAITVITPVAIEETTKAAVSETKKPVEKPVSEPAIVPVVEPVSEPAIENTVSDSLKTEKRIEYIIKKNRHISREDAENIVALCEELTAERDYISAELLIGLVRHESTFRADAGTNYIGLMQISAKYAEGAGLSAEDLKDPRTNLEYGLGMLDELNIKCNGNIKYILTAYNMGYYGFKKKLDAGEEISYSFYNKCQTYADQITAMYE